MRKFILLMTVFLLISLVSAQCNDQNFPVECIAGGVDLCIPNNLICSSACCVSGNCDSWQDYSFCSDSYPISNCNNRVLNCCPQNAPIWVEQTQSCWPSSWECVDDIG